MNGFDQSFLLKKNKIFFYRARSIHKTGPVLWIWLRVSGSGDTLVNLGSIRRSILGVSYGLLTFFSTGIGGALGPVLGGFIFDKTGSYRSGWIMNTVFLLIISLLILALKPKSIYFH